MVKVGTTYTVTVTPEEAAAIADAMNAEYKRLREQAGGRAAEEAGKMNLVRDIRNGYAGLINRTYCGIDA